MQTTDGIVYTALLLAAALAAVLKKLTITGAVTGAVLAALTYAGGGMISLTALAIFFISGSFATYIGISKKLSLGLYEENKGRRKAGQVLANGGMAALSGLMHLVFPGSNAPFALLICASLAAATADTLSSELGNVYGKRFYNIITFKRDTRGLNGVVSLEGTLAGVAGSVMTGLIYWAGYPDLGGAFIVVIAGTAGTFTDSVLGATLERRGLLNNNLVNFLNTLTGAATAGVLWLILK